MNIKFLRRIAWFLLIIYSYELIYPIKAFALTSGPSAPETKGFTPIGTTNMVDNFTGDFSYNIPLMDVGGYPVTLGYKAGISMEQEASWVGLGWSLTPGAINRNMRGIPDDFKGDVIQKTNNVKSNWTVGFGGGAGDQLFGVDMLNFSAGAFFNSYNGPGVEYGVNISAGIGDKLNGGLTAGLNFNSQSGLDLNGGLSLSSTVSGMGRIGLSANGGINSRQGLKDISFKTDEQFQLTTHDKHDFAYSASFKLPSLSANYSFSYPTFTPSPELEFTNTSVTIQATFGSAEEGNHNNGDVKGYYTNQSLSNPSPSYNAYGQMYQGGMNTSISGIMLDFNREKDIPVSSFIKSIAIPIATMDQFNAEGEGISGQYQISRNDAGFYFDGYKSDGSGGFSGGIEAGGGGIAHFGGDVNVNTSTTKSGKWTGDESNFMDTYTNFNNYLSNQTYEPYFFKNISESSIFSNNTLFKTTGGLDATKPTVFGGASPIAISSLGGSYINSAIPTNDNSRIKRNSIFKVFTIDELSNAAGLGHNANVRIYPANSLVWDRHKSGIVALPFENIAGTHSDATQGAKDQHIGEIQILNDKGSTYVYGLPVYNLESVDVSFRTDVPGESAYNYYTKKSATKDNDKGKDHYYSRTVVPAYAHSFLLTAILSPDYVDVKNDGITADDLGTATQFNYTTPLNDDKTNFGDAYGWRTPTKPSSDASTDVLANYQEGMYALSDDQTANYSYGEKRLWYLRTIESKNEVAFFYTSDRRDGLGVIPDPTGDPSNGDPCNGELYGTYSNSIKQQKLDSIVLYSKADLNAKGDAATPIKIVHFCYDYSLCRKVDNSADFNSSDTTLSGKLTLKKVYFTYGRNTRGQLNKYSFNYKNVIETVNNGTAHVDYKPRKSDKWGNYQDPVLFGLPGYPDQSIYPYTIQDRNSKNPIGKKNIQQELCDVWCLNNIQLPSGGNIEINYEPDDYSYVQNKSAGQMFFIKGVGTASTFLGSGNDIEDLYTGTHDDAAFADYIFFDLNGADIHSLVDPLGGTLYYTAKVEVSKENDGRWEYIKGYADIAGFDAIGDLGYIKLKECSVHGYGTDENAGENSYNPIVLNALQTLRLKLPSIAYPGSDYSDPGTSPFAILNTLTGIAGSLGDMIKGFTDRRIDNSHCKKIDCNHNSWIRLATPYFKDQDNKDQDYLKTVKGKYGGGNRVKTIKIHDAWNSFVSGEKDFYYGQQYDYTITDPSGAKYSSGVALWEPALGSDENLFKTPVVYEEVVKCAPDNSFYIEEPYGEALYPSASIGYSQVKVSNLSYAGEDVSRTSTGYTVYKFKTAKDFPTITQQTKADIIPYKSSPLASLFSMESQAGLTASQGFTVEVNDMHGKPASIENYDVNGTLVSSTVYQYQVDNPDASVQKLVNSVTTIGSDGQINNNEEMGIDYDCWGDSRWQASESNSIGGSGNIEILVFPPPVPPLPIPTLFPSYSKDKRDFHSLAFVKYIRRHGIVSKVTKMDKGSTIATSNLIYDKQTGQDVLDATQNEWGDTIYNIKLPAYWAYKGMGQAYQNVGVHLTITADATNADQIISPTADVLFPGDVLWLKDGGIWKEVTVINVNNIFKLMGADGEIIPSPNNDQGIIIRSGRRNLLDKLIEEKTTLNKNSISKLNAAKYDSCICLLPQQIDGEGGEDGGGGGGEGEGLAPQCIMTYYVNSTSPPEFNKNPYDCYAKDTVLNDIIITYHNLWPVDEICLNGSNHFNPYKTGNLGIWRPDTVYQFRNYRFNKADDTHDNNNQYAYNYTNLRKDGQFAEKVFWKTASSAPDQLCPNKSTKPAWVASNMITLYDKNGNELENSNSLNIYSSALFGYDNNLSMAVASNTRYRNIANDNFEDYDFMTKNSSCGGEKIAFHHWTFFDVLPDPTGDAVISEAQSHTGLRSLLLPKGGDNLTLEKTLTDYRNSPDSVFTQSSDGSFTQGVSDTLPHFNPVPASYLISAWVKKDTLCSCAKDMKGGIDVIVGDTYYGVRTSLLPTGPVIDGWQRIEGIFNLSGDTYIDVVLKNTNAPLSNINVYYDDIRICPLLSNMKTFVYNPYNLRLMATLDENNYATFYEYDDSGKLVRVKKETEKGIVTIQESRNANKEQ